MANAILAQAQAHFFLPSCPPLGLCLSALRVAAIPPLNRRVMPVDEQLKSLLNNVPESYINWLSSVGLTSVRLFAARVEKRDEVESKLVEVAIPSEGEGAGKWPGMKFKEGDVAEIKLAWEASQKFMAGLDEDTVASTESKPMDTPRLTNLTTLWNDHHHFKFSSQQVLSLNLANKLYKHATATPKMFCVISPEDLKLRNVVSTGKEKATCTLEEGKPMEYKAVEVDPCTSQGQLFDRIIALFNTWCFVTIETKEWLQYQTVRDFELQFKHLFFRRVGGDRAPLEIQLKSYLRMMNLFMDQVNQHNKTLDELLKSTWVWESIWTSWHPSARATPAVPKQDDDDPQKYVSMQLDKRVEEQMLRVHKMANSILNPKGKGKGLQKFKVGQKGQKGKGKTKTKFQNGKGKGKGKQWKKQNQNDKPWNKAGQNPRPDTNQWKKKTWY